MKVIAYRKSLVSEIILFSLVTIFMIVLFIIFLIENYICGILIALFFIIMVLTCLIILLKIKKELILYDEENKVLRVYCILKYHNINIKDILLMQEETIRVSLTKTTYIAFYLNNKKYMVGNIKNIDEAINSLKELNINMELNKYFKETYYYKSQEKIEK